MILAGSASAAFAAHTSSATIAPGWAKGSTATTYTVHITNNGPDAVEEIRITPPYSSLVCGIAPSGWNFDAGLSGSTRCVYTTTSPLTSSNSKDFALNAITPASSETSTWLVKTKDINEVYYVINPTTGVDAVAPTTSQITFPVSDAYVKGVVPITADAQDNVEGSGISKVEFYDGSNKIGEDTTAPYSAEWNTIGITEGSHALTAVAIDNAGNSITSSDVSVTVDNILPIVSVTAPKSGSPIYKGKGQTVSVSYTYTETNPTSTVINIKSGATIIGIATVTGLVSGTNTRSDDVVLSGDAVEGKYTLEVTLTDKAGNSATATENDAVLVDNTAPVTTDNAPMPEDWQNVDVGVTLSAIDPLVSGVSSGVANTQYCVDQTDTCTPTTTGTSVSITTEADNSLRYKSTDVVGHVEITKSRHIKLDKTPPTPVTGLTASSYSDGSVRLSWDPSTDAKSGLKQYLIYRNTVSGFIPDNSNKIATVPAGTTTYIDSLSGDEGAIYYYVVRAQDNANNIEMNTNQVSAEKITASKLEITPASLSIVAGSWTSKYTVALKGSDGTILKAASPVVVDLTTAPASSTGRFSTGPGSLLVTTITIPVDSSSADFYYSDTTAGSLTIRVSSGSLTSGTSELTITHAAAAKYVILNPVDGTVDAPITVTVELQDQYGNLISTGVDKDKDVTLTASGEATGAGLVDIMDGVRTKAISGVIAQTVTLGLIDSQSTGFDVSSTQDVVFAVGAANKLVFTTQPSPTATAGVDFAQQPVVTIQDQHGNTRTSDTDSVTLSAYTDSSCTVDATGTLSGTTKAAVSGVATYTDVDYTKAETIYLKATSGPITSACSSSVAVSPASIASYEVTATTPQIAGNEFTGTVTAKDSYGNVVSTDDSTIITMTNSGNAVFYTDGTYTTTTTTYTLSSGTATIYLKDTKAETITLTATDSNSKTGTSGSVLINPAAAATFDVATQYSGIETAGVPFSVTLTAKDTYGNVVNSGPNNYNGDNSITWTWTAHDAPSGTPTKPADGNVAFTNGVATIDGFTLVNAGETPTITATAGSVSGTTSAITVKPAAIDHLTVTGITDPVDAGAQTSPTVTAYDQYENVKKDYVGTIEFSSDDTQAILPVDYTFMPTDNGVHTFTNGVTLKTAGEKYVKVEDSINPSATGRQFDITVNHAVATSIAITPDPVTMIAGYTQAYAVIAKDAYNNEWDVTPDTTFDITVGAGGSWAGATYTSDKAGTWIVMGTYGLLADSASLTVSPANAASITITPADATTVSADMHTQIITATLKDASGNLVADGTIVTWTSGNPAFALSSASSPTIAGVATVTLVTTIHAGDSGTVTAENNGVPATTAAITVVAGATKSYFVSPTTSISISADIHSVPVTAQAKDAFGNDVKEAGRTVTWTESNGGTFASLTTNTDANGLAANTLTTSTVAGTNHVVTASEGTIAGDSAAITVTSGALAKYLVSPTTSTTMSADTHSIPVAAQAQDAYGNNVRTAGISVTWTATNGGTFASNPTVTDGNGVATNTLTTSTTAGTSHVVTAATGENKGDSAIITVTYGVAIGLALGTIPSPQTSGTAFTIMMTAKDANSNTVTNYAGPIPDLNDLTGTITPKNPSTPNYINGVWTKSVTITKAATADIITAKSGSINGASNAFDVLAGAMDAGASSVIATPQVLQADGTSIATILVTLKDQYGNPIPDQAVTLYSNKTGDAVSSPAATNATGQTTATISSTAKGVSKITAGTGAVNITQKAYVNFYDLILNPSLQWNLVSIPSPVDRNDTSTVFAGSQIWAYNGTEWLSPAKLEAGKGYWVSTHQSEGLNYLKSTGVPSIPSYVPALQTGWNLIGFFSKDSISIEEAMSDAETMKQDYKAYKYLGKDGSGNDQWSVYSSIYSGTNFNVNAGEGYWVLNSGDYSGAP